MNQSDNKAGSDTSQLLADIETFSRQGPVTSQEPVKPEIHREVLAFPDLNKAHVGDLGPTVPKATPSAAPTSTPGQVDAGSGSLLARLKQQAETLQKGTEEHSAAKEEQARILSDGIATAFHYLDDVIKQLNIIKPSNPREFDFPGNILFANMGWIEGATDFRRVPTASDDHRYESLTVRFRIAAGRDIVVEREGTSVEPFRKLLHDYSIVFTADEKMNARNIVERARFTFPCEIKAGFVLKADYEMGNLVLRTRNIDRFGMMEFKLQPADICQETLDELTKLFLGEKNRFLQMFRRSA